MLPRDRIPPVGQPPQGRTATSRPWYRVKARVFRDRIERVARREVLFAVLAVFSVMIGISRFGNPAPAPVWLKVTDVAIASAFLVDWVARVRNAPRRLRYLMTHSYEVLFFVPYTLLPAQASGGNILRGARLFRVLRVLRYGRYVKLGLGMGRLPRRMRRLQAVARNAELVTLTVTGIITVSVGAAALMVAEGTAVGLRDYGDAFWWSLSLFTTVAYAVPEPTTSAGHIVSGLLMVAGVIYLGIFTASLASAILRTPEEST